MKYSKTTFGFYDPEINTYIPADAVDVPYATYQALLAGQSAGQVIGPDANGNPVLLPVTLAAAQATQIALLTAAYQNAIQVSVNFTSAGGVTKSFQADKNSQDNLAKMLDAYRGTGIAPTGFYWVAGDNTQVPFTYADMQGLAATMGAQGWAAFQHLQIQKAAVNAAATVAAVQAIIW